MLKRIEAVEGIALTEPKFSDALATGLEQLQALQGLVGADQTKKFAISASVHSFNVLLAAAGTVCKLDLYGDDAEIDLVAGVGGALIYQCRHDPAHTWDLSGNRIK